MKKARIHVQQDPSSIPGYSFTINILIKILSSPIQLQGADISCCKGWVTSLMLDFLVQMEG